MGREKQKKKTVLFLVEDVPYKYLFEYIESEHKKKSNYKIEIKISPDELKTTQKKLKRNPSRLGYEKCFLVFDGDTGRKHNIDDSDNIHIIFIDPCIEALFMTIIKQKPRYSMEKTCEKIKSEFNTHCKRNKSNKKPPPNFVEKCVDKDEAICKALETLSQDPNIKTLKEINKILAGEF